MACEYYYKNKLIGNINDLNSFLTFKFPNYQLLGDYVFSFTDILHGVIEAFNTAQAIANKVKPPKHIEYAYIDGELVEVYKDGDSIGTSSFISKYRKEDGSVISPYYDEELYWGHRVSVWKNAKQLRKLAPSGQVLEEGYTEEEKYLLETDTLEPLEVDSKWFEGERLIKDRIPKTSKVYKLIEDIEKRWEYQAKLGIAIHNIFATYFKTIPSTGTKLYEEWENYDEETNLKNINNSINQYFKKNEPGNLGYIDDKYLSRELIISIITNECKHLREELENRFLTAKEKEQGLLLLITPEPQLAAPLSTYVTNKEIGAFRHMKSRFDLVVTTPSGNTKIIDFKVGNKNYRKYDSAKTLTYVYLQAFYNRISQINNVASVDLSIENFIVPIEIKGLRKEDKDFVFDSWEFNKDNGNILRDITSSTSATNILQEVNQIMPQPLHLNLPDTELLQKHEKLSAFLFGESVQTSNEITEQQVKSLVTNYGKDEFKPNELGFYSYEVDNGFTIEVNASEENAEKKFLEKVRLHLLAQPQSSKANTQSLRHAIQKAIEDGSNLDETSLKVLGEANIKRLNKYCTPNWQISQNPNAELLYKLYNILVFESTNSVGEPIIEVVKLTTKDPILEYKGVSAGRSNCDFLFASNNSEEIKQDSLMLKAVRGNIELLDTMLLLHECGFENTKINNIALISTHYANSKYFSAKPEEIEYSLKQTVYKALKYAEPNHFIKEFNFLDTLDVADQVDQFMTTFLEMLSEPFALDLTELYGGLVELCKSNSNNTLELINKVLEFINALEKMSSSYFKDKINAIRNFSTVIDPTTREGKLKLLYIEAHKVLMDLYNFKNKLVLRAHSNWMDDVNVLSQGWSGNLVDNAGNFRNYYVNEVSKLIINTTLSIRENLFSSLRENAKDVEILDQAKGVNGNSGNPTKRFVGMTYLNDKKNDILFINPWAKEPQSKIPPEFTDADFDYLKKSILKINKIRNPNLNEEAVIESLSRGTNLDNIQYLRVPIVPADKSSQVALLGILKFLELKFEPFMDKEKFKEWVKTKSLNLTNEDLMIKDKESEIFKVLNTFKESERPGTRELVIKDLLEYNNSDYCYDINIEKVIGLFKLSQVVSKMYTDVMPVIKGASLCLLQQGIFIGENFENDLTTIEELVKRNVNHQSLGTPMEKRLQKLTSFLTQLTSYRALAFSLKQWYGQIFDGIAKKAKLKYIYDGLEGAPFTAKELDEAWDFVNKKENLPFLEQFNQFFGLNDMGLDLYVENLKYSNNYNLLFNFNRAAFYTASRPDFYNRLTLFIAQMKHQGSFDAYSLDTEGNLKYDAKKDDRLRAFLTEDTSDMAAYNKSKSIYISLAKDLIQEKVANFTDILNMQDIKLPPKAYSNKEIESMKALGDMLYGYYDTEKRSLFLSKWAGGLFGLMRTYISSKKNMYIGPEGVTNRGYMDSVAKENLNEKGEKVYLMYALDDEGNIDPNNVYWSDDEEAKLQNKISDVQVMRWKGDVNASIITVLVKLARREGLTWKSKILHPEKSLLELCTDEKTGEVNVKLYETYLFNYRMFVADLMTWSGLSLVGEVFHKGIGVASAAASSPPVKALLSFIDDFAKGVIGMPLSDSNIFGTVSDVLLDTNPMVSKELGKMAKEVVNICTGNDVLKNLSHATPATKMLYNTIEAGMK